MDRFSRTTEIDTAEIVAATMEDDTPKKSKASIIIAIIVCLFVAVVIWLWVMEADTEITSKGFDDIPVYTAITDTTPLKTIDITVNGIRKNIIDFKAEDFKIIETTDGYEVFLSEEKAELFNLKNESVSGEIIVSVSAK
ncbi:MAG: hypothetical protein IKA43_04575 [Clostridia bacterium]|nr:hypothetical protein [Clostridia bacterium]MBR2296664.1 hypothetical protein [Clostridia bacterium]